MINYTANGGGQLLRILIADDDNIIRRGLKAIIEKNLSKDFLVVGEVSNGSAAIEIIIKDNIDLLITDIKMPVMDGMQLIKEISKLNIKTKIIVLSGFDEYKYVRESLKNGAVDYLLKPINKDAFIDLVKKIKNEKDMQIENELQSKMYLEKMELNKGILKECFLVDLVKENVLKKEYIEAKLMEFGINNSLDFLVAVIGIDDLTKTKIETVDSLKATLLNSIKQKIESEFLLEKGIKVIMATYKNEIIALFINEDFHLKNIDEYVIKIIQVIKETVFANEEYTFSMGISNMVQSIDDIHLAYTQAENAFKRRFYKGTNSIIVFLKNDDLLKPIDEEYIKVLLKLLINGIDMGDLKEVMSNISSIMLNIKENSIDSHSFKTIFSNIILKVYEFSKEFKEVEYSYLNDEDKLLFNIESIEIYKELEEYVLNTFEIIINKVNQIRKNRSAKIIEKAKEYILENYSKDISLKSVSEYVFLNASYFSFLFKNETGKNFVDYLIETRVDVAKKLLHQPEIKVYEISKMVGYNETTSFNRTFKRIVGVAPSDYKKIIK